MDRYDEWRLSNPDGWDSGKWQCEKCEEVYEEDDPVFEHHDPPSVSYICEKCKEKLKEDL